MTTILIVDDQPDHLTMLRDILTSDGYDTLQATNGLQGLQLAQSQQPDLIVLDILMPEMDGFEVCEHLKRQADTQTIPIIFISALSDGASIARGLQLGATDYINIPFQPAELLARTRHHVRLLEQQRQMERHYQHLNTLRNQFIQSATHDLKNPLHIIQSYAQLLDEHEDIAHSEDARRYVQRILVSTQRMWDLVTDMLDLAHLENGMALSLQEASINQMLTRTIYEFELDAQKRGVVLVSEIMDEDRIIQVDVSAFLRVLENLLSNALKYTPTKGKILLRAWVQAQQLFISVSDDGMGIPSEELSRVFEPFYRVNQREVHEVEGSGLGLSIVKLIVEQHGGQVEVQSTMGYGTTFTLRLPLLAEA